MSPSSPAPSSLRIFLDETTTKNITVDEGYHASHQRLDDEGHAAGGEFDAHNNRTEITTDFDTSRVQREIDDVVDVVEKHYSSDTTTETHNRQENGTYRDELQEEGGYERIADGTFTLVDQVHTVGVNDPSNQGNEFWQFVDGTLVIYVRTDVTVDDTETNTTTGKYGNGKLTQTTITTSNKTVNSRGDNYYQYALLTDPVDEFSGWAKDHWRVDQVITTEPNKETGLIETTARKTERIYGTKSDTNARFTPNFNAGPSPYQQNTTLVPFDYTDYTQTVSIVDTNGALLKFDKSVTIDPLTDPPPTRPVVTYEELVAAGVITPGNGDSETWAWWKTFGWEGGKALVNQQDGEYVQASNKIALGEVLYFLNTVTAGYAGTGDYAQQLFDEAGIDRDLQLIPKGVANAGAAVTWVIGGQYAIAAVGSTAAGGGIATYVGANVSPVILSNVGYGIAMIGATFSVFTAYENIESGEYDKLGFDLGGLAASGAVGRQAAKFVRPQRVSADEVFEDLVQVGPPRSARTTLVLETKQGQLIAAGGASDLSGAQLRLAQQRGAHIAADPGRHAEIKAIAAAGERGLLPTRGRMNVEMCSDCEDEIRSLLDGSVFDLKLSDDRLVFEFIKN